MRLDVQAEQALVGSMLIDEECRAAMLAKMKPEDFGSKPCEAAFRAMQAMTDEGVPVDFITVAGRCETDDPEIGSFLRECAELTVTTANADEYAAIIKKNAASRRIAAIGDELILADVDARAGALKGIEQLQAVLDETASADVVDAKRWAADFLEEERTIIQDPASAYCATGWRDLDKLLGGGLVNSGLYILGARPGMGKTTVALNIAEQVASRGVPALFVSLEMSRRQVMCKRVAAATPSTPYGDLIAGTLDWTQQVDMEESLEKLKKRPLYVNNRVGLTVSDIAGMARQVRGCRMIVVDYFGLISVEGGGRGRYEDYTAISGRLKQLACQLNVPILCLAQLNREAQKRQKKRPILSDLRDTGAIEQDADGVIFLHRDAYYEEGKAAQDDGVIELILAKNRHGKTGTIKMYWEGAASRVSAFSERTERSNQK